MLAVPEGTEDDYAEGAPRARAGETHLHQLGQPAGSRAGTEAVTVAGPNGEAGRAHGIPAAFRGRVPAAVSFVGLNDAQVLQAATNAFRTAQTLPVGGVARQRQWERYDDAMAELAGRGLRHILRRLRERGELADGEVIPDDLR